MVFVKDPGRPGNVKTVLIIFSPGQLQHRIQIIPDHCAFRHHGGHREQAVNLFVQALYYFFRQGQRLDLFPVFFRFRMNIFRIAQFLADNFYLFPQIIFFLILLNILMHLLGNTLFQLGNRHFLVQDLIQFFQSGFHRHRFQQQLSGCQIHIQITGYGICHNACIRIIFKRKQYLRTDFFAQQHPFFKFGNHHTAQRFQFQAVFIQRLGRQFRNRGSPATVHTVSHPVCGCTAEPFHQNPHRTTRQLEHLPDLGNYAHFVKIIQRRLFCF